ncbi:MAG: glycosyltransferase family 2 protein [Thiotrichales bacterium]
MTAIKHEGDLPKVTVMIPTYRQSAWILDAVDSALAQDYPNLEVIVADDASPDATAAVAAQRHDPRLRVESNSSNLGRVGNYRHLLYDLACGEWVVNLDGDDYFSDPGFISSAIAVTLREPEVVIVGARVAHRTGTSETAAEGPRAGVIEGLEMLARLDDTRYRLMHPATLYHRDTALRCEFYRVNAASADWESLFRLAARGRVAYLDRVVAVWRLHGGNSSQQLDWQGLFANVRIWDAIYANAMQHGMNPRTAESVRARVVYSQIWRDLARLLTARKPGAAWHYAKAVRALTAGASPSLRARGAILGRIVRDHIGARMRGT